MWIVFWMISESCYFNCGFKSVWHCSWREIVSNQNKFNIGMFGKSQMPLQTIINMRFEAVQLKIDQKYFLIIRFVLFFRTTLKTLCSGTLRWSWNSDISPLTMTRRQHQRHQQWRHRRLNCRPMRSRADTEHPAQDRTASFGIRSRTRWLCIRRRTSATSARGWVFLGCRIR